MSAEQSVIGSTLMDASVIDKIADIISPPDFQDRRHIEIWATVKNLYDEGKPVDVVTVHEANKNLDLKYLADLKRNTPTSANVKHYAEVVRKDSVERQLAKAGAEISELAKDHTKSVDDKLDLAQQKLTKLTETKAPEPTLSQIISESLNGLQTRYESGGIVTGISTGLIDLDNKTGGLQKSDLIILAARPSMGKTTLAMDIAISALNQDKPVQIFSMEMSSTQLVDRAICSRGGILYDAYNRGKIDEEWPLVTEAVSWLNSKPLHIDDTGALTINELRTKARRAKREKKAELIIVDYIQLMTGSGENRTNIISDISRSLKALAKELNIPIIALSQLNRQLETRSDKRPMLSDLRESGSIEQDADLVLFLYRDEIYFEDSDYKGVAELIIGKQRRGPVGKIYLTEQLHHCRFRNFIGELPRTKDYAGAGY